MASIPDKLVPGYNLFIGDEPPLAPNENDLWFDTISNKWWVWTGGVWTTVGSGTGVPEAPTDGAAYRRIDAAWLTDPLAGDAPINGVSYLRKNGTWAAASESTGVPEAPNDNKPYHRKNLAWEEDPLFGDAPIDGNYYLRQDGAWVPSGAALGVPEAPNDGVGYTRKDEAWAADPLQADAALDSKHYGRYNAAWTAVPIQSDAANDSIPKLRLMAAGVASWLDAGDSAQKDVGTAADEVAAGDHTHVTLPTTNQKAGLDAAATPITGANPVLTAGDAGVGDMTKAVYDPQGFNGDAFARANHTGTQVLATISNAGNSAGLNTGTTAGTVALGDHGHATLLNPNQKAGIDANASLSGLNAVATMADLPAGGGDVVGPATAVDGNLAVFDGTTGKLIKDGGVPGSGGIEEPVDDGNPKMRRTLTGVSTWITSGGAAVLNVGVSAGTVAAGDHGHVTLPTTDQKAGLDAAATPITGANPVITAADVTGGGDMTKAVYDPTGINSSAFTRVNHTGTQTLATISDSGDSAGLDVGTIAGTVAAGDHTHVTVPVHATTHKTGGADVILLDELGSPTDITALNVSVTAHGLTPKAPNDAAQFLNGLGSWSIPDVGASESVAMAVYNETGATLAKGSAVYVNGWKTGNEVPTVALAQSNSSTTMPALGIVIADMISSSEGTVQVAGAIPGFDTSAYALNSPLYVDAAIAGNLTETKPAESHLIQSLAKVLRVNVSNGSLVVAGALRSNDIPNFSAADKFWYGGTLGGATEGDVTVYARTIMDDPDATATRITLGLGDSSVLDVGTTTNTVAAGDHTHATLPTTDQKAALDGANGPSAGNEFATVSDLKSIFPDRVAITQSGATLDTDLDGNAYTVQLIDAGNTTGWSTAALPSPSTKEYTCSVDFLAPATGSSTVAVNGAWQQMGVSGAITMAAGEDPVSCILRSRTDGIIQLYRSETAA